MCRLICTNNANVPADLQSAGIKYKDFQSAYFLFMIYKYEFRIADPDTLCCRIFRCAQQHVHIRQNITLVVSQLYHHNAYELFTLHSSFFT